jgi:hypothetical protein
VLGEKDRLNLVYAQGGQQPGGDKIGTVNQQGPPPAFNDGRVDKIVGQVNIPGDLAELWQIVLPLAGFHCLFAGSSCFPFDRLVSFMLQ